MARILLIISLLVGSFFMARHLLFITPIKKVAGPSYAWPTGTDGALVITAGNTVTIPARSIKNYSSIQIDAGGTLDVDVGNGWTYVGCLGNLILNGTIRARKGFGPNATFNDTSPTGEAVSYSVTSVAGGASAIGTGSIVPQYISGTGGAGGGYGAQPSYYTSMTQGSGGAAGSGLSGNGGNGTSSYDSQPFRLWGGGGGMGVIMGTGGVTDITYPGDGGGPIGGAGTVGGGGGCSNSDTGCTPPIAGTLGKAGSGGWGSPNGSGTGYFLGGSGGGGAHGQGLFIAVIGTVSGSGTIDVRGADGGDGAPGGNNTSKFPFQCPACSGGGGGNGGKIIVRTPSGTFPGITLLTSGGAGGSAGAPLGGPSGNNGTAGPSGSSSIGVL